ncbi:MAG TPA: cysteine desulfurase family protein [Acidimicrobiales bacterium]|nr:cysteine desulfurase family protein [Acidimicrobiales bacterium]
MDRLTTYLDHAATTPVRPEVVAAMAPFASERFGNPSGSHRLARDARTALDDARDAVAAAVGADPGDVVFTSGGTEADNLAVLGTLPGHPATIVTSSVEHPAVLEPARAAARLGFSHQEAPVDADGAVDLDRLADLLGPHVAVVSVMLANNEVGTVQPFDQVARLVRRHAPQAALHTDAVQAAPWLDLARLAADADLLSVSAHKLGGPKGAGALVARVPVRPILHGGGQERDRRSGTHDVAGAVGLATALTLAAAERDPTAARVRALRDRLADGLLAAVPGTVESAPRDRVLPGHCHLRFAGVDQEELLVLLDRDGVCAAAGSACASGALQPSHVLLAMGVPPADAKTAVRFTLGHTSTDADVDRALAAVPAAVARLRG